MHRRIIKCLFIVILLTACGKEIPQGAIIRKGYDPSYVWFNTIYVGKSVIIIPETVPEQWWIKIKACGAAAGKDDGSCRTRDVIVSQQEHDTLKIGETYTVKNS